MLLENSNVPSESIDAGIKAPEIIDMGRADIRHADPSSLAVFPTEPQGPSVLPGPAAKMAQLLKGKDKGWAANFEKRGPLRLLDLPMDVLKEIIKEVTHTNDLTSLALTHSALNNLAVPYIYSRFDIVWPETQITTDPRIGVDALTYGLSTLVMSEGAFANTAPQVCGHYNYCTNCGKLNHIGTVVENKSTALRSRRRGNNFAQYTRKFSLGNGPPEWVQEYLISKESGKMLGTLVALAIARMPSLETFVWDMPTGILRDVWSALASLGDRCDGEEPRLERIWIRWHDNRSMTAPTDAQNPGPLSQPQATAQATLAGVPLHPMYFAANMGGNIAALTDSVRQGILARSYRTVEHPNFSILPALKSVTVLDIDEPAYLDELSVLIERSIESLRELRLGLASWFNEKNLSPTDIGISPITHAEAAIDYDTSGGLFGMVMSKIYDCRWLDPRRHPGTGNVSTKHAEAELVADNPLEDLSIPIQQMTSVEMSNHIGANSVGIPSSEQSAVSPQKIAQTAESHVSSQPLVGIGEVEIPTTSLAAITRPNSVSLPSTTHELSTNSLPVRLSSASKSSAENSSMMTSETSGLSHQTSLGVTGCLVPKQKILKLEILELEKVPLCVPVMQKTVDWTVLTTLTLLNCQSDEELWKALRRTYAPRTNILPHLFSPNSSNINSSRSQPKKPVSTFSSDYALRLKRIHTNNVSTSLITFLKEALAPNTLEWMFLQDGGKSPSKVTVDAIYRGPLRRHRESLKKVMIDSGDRRSRGPTRNTKWKKWMLNPEVLSFVTSGKMSCLRELAIALEHKHWHFFLQRLPQISHLRSLYIPYMADHVHGHELDARELALQVVDIVTLRPEIELCYLGIAAKCFEILESKQSDDPLFVHGDSLSASANNGPGGVVMANPDEDSETDEDNGEDEDDNGDGDQGTSAFVNPDGNDSDNPEGSEVLSDDEDGEMARGNKRQLNLREILFYDDKARCGFLLIPLLLRKFKAGEIYSIMPPTRQAAIRASRPIGGVAAQRPLILSLLKLCFLGILNFPLLGAAPTRQWQVVAFAEDDDVPMSSDKPTLWIYLAIAIALVLLGGAFAGLTIALMGQDAIYLEVIKTSGDGAERQHAAKVLKLLNRGKHWVLVTLLLGNVITNETLPIVLDRSLGGGWPAVLGSTVLIVIFGEIIPQSICVRYGLPIGAWMSSLVVILMYILSPVAWPTAKLLDYLLGEDHGTTYKKAGLKTLVTLHRTLGSAGEQLNMDEVTIISSVLDLKEKPIGNIMTPMDDVFVMSADTVLDEDTMDIILSAGYSRIPIHTPDNPTNFVGMLLVKILITYDPEDCKPVRDFALATLPETSPETSCLDIVNFFQEGKSHMVLVSNSPGKDFGALGVVTLEDVIEELIGEEIVDESDVFIDVHKRMRRLNPAPKNRMPKPKIVADPVDNAAEGEEDLINIDDSLPPTNQTLQRLISSDGVPESKRKPSSAELETSPNNPAHMPRRTSSLAGVSDRENVAKRADTPEMRELLKHLRRGPSNLASRPRQTRYPTVKIKPGMGAVSESATKQPGAEENLKTMSMSTAPQGGVGEGLVQSAGKDAKDGVHAVQVGYGSMETPPRTPASPNKFKDSPANGASKRPEHDRRESSESVSTVGSLPEMSQSPLLKRGVRSGSITENIIEAGGFQKVVLETTSSSEEIDKAVNGGAIDGSDDNRKENVKPTDEGQDKTGKKKRRRRRKKTSGEETPLLERDGE
ncbi:hypothetical protein MMC18_008743 [Xylographa bjoerkii]|nr:hypothetical protein [Xylographa bjoerkii]